MTEKESVCRVAGKIVTIVVLDDGKEVGPMKSAAAYRNSPWYDKDHSAVAVRVSRMGKADKVYKGRGKLFASSVRKRTRPGKIGFSAISSNSKHSCRLLASLLIKTIKDFILSESTTKT